MWCSRAVLIIGVEESTPHHISITATVDDEYEVPNCATFAGPKHRAVNVLPKKSSVLDKCGRRLILPGGRVTGDGEYELDESIPDTHFFHCLLCEKVNNFTLIKLTASSTGLGAKHCKEVHNFESEYTRTKRAKENALELQVEENSGMFKDEPVRYCQLIMTGMVFEKCIPFNFFEGEYFARFLSTHPHGKKLKNFNPRKTLAEMYATFKLNVAGLHESMVKAFPGLPYLNVNMDLYTSPVQNKKYVALRGNWYDGTRSDSAPSSVTFAVRAYSPASNGDASEVLYQWMVAHLALYIIDYDLHVLSSTADFGPDVRKCFVTHASTPAEWCIAHLLNCAFVDAFGASADRSETKHRESRNLFNKLRKVVESVNKSQIKQSTFIDIQSNMFGRTAKLKNHPIHRWGSAEGMLKSTLCFWPALRNTYERLAEPFALEEHFDDMLHLHAVISPVRDVQKTSQMTKSTSLFKTYLDFHVKYATTLNPLKPLKVSCPPVPATVRKALMERRRAEWTTEAVEHDNLTPVAQRARELLRDAVNKRFFHRYHALLSLKNPKQLYGKHARSRGVSVEEAKIICKFSHGFDMACALNPHPLFKEFTMVKAAINSFAIHDYNLDGYPQDLLLHDLQTMHLEVITVVVWRKVKALAVLACKGRLGDSAASSSTADHASPPPAKKAKTSSRDIDILDAFGLSDGSIRSSGTASGVSEGEVPDTPDQIVQKQIESFRAAVTTSEEFTEEECDNGGVAWWKAHEADMPDLAKVAAVLRGFLPSSGGLECNLGSMKDILQPKRASLDPEYVNAIMALKLNRHDPKLVPSALDKVCRLGDDWKRTLCANVSIEELVSNGDEAPMESAGVDELVADDHFDLESDSADSEDSDDSVQFRHSYSCR